jgi:hypothetical protein
MFSTSLSKGCKKMFTATKMAITQSIYITHYIHVTPITGSEILSGFQIIL